jgi:hypothetical protein
MVTLAFDCCDEIKGFGIEKFRSCSMIDLELATQKYADKHVRGGREWNGAKRICCLQNRGETVW